MSSKPWQKFSVGKPSSQPRWEEKTCRALLRVGHVAHVPTALRIVEDGRLRADLVFDESKLNTQRIRVVWLSPNDWDGAGGFRYGNVRFQFDWATLAKGKKYFWVESIAYGVEACRLLITDTDYSATLDAYDPEAGDGPWWRDKDGKHHWNGEYCLEVMYEGDLDLSNAETVDFVKHHEKRCNIAPGRCQYSGKSASLGGSEFIAALAARRTIIDAPGLIETGDKGQKPASALYNAFVSLIMSCDRLSITTWGTRSSTDQDSISLARAVLNSIGNPDLEADTENLARLFANREELKLSIAAAIDKAVGLPAESGFFHELSS